MLRACGPIFSLQRRPPRHPAGARRTEIASLPLVRCPLQESKTMSKNKMLSRALFAALVGAATFGAQAAEEPGFYLGAGAGQSFVDETGYDDEDTAFSAFGGYQFNQWFGLEAGYADLGELEPGVAGQSLEASSAYFTAVGTLPFTDKFSGYAKAGFQRWDLDTSIPGLAGTGDDSGTDRSEEHTSELQSLMRISYAVFCLKKKKKKTDTKKSKHTDDK